MGFWTPERTDTLTAMWIAGSSSAEIRDAIGAVSRDAVIGRINKLGLTGKGGSGRGFGTAQQRRAANDNPVFEAIDHTFSLAIGTAPDRNRPLHRSILVLLAAIVARRDPHFTARHSGLSLDVVRTILANAHETGVWRAGDPGPRRDWSERTELLCDAALAMDLPLAA